MVAGEGASSSILQMKLKKSLVQVYEVRCCQIMSEWLSSQTCLYHSAVLQVLMSFQGTSFFTTCPYSIYSIAMAFLKSFQYISTYAFLLDALPPHSSATHIPPQHSSSKKDMGKHDTRESSNLTQLPFFLRIVQQCPTSGVPECTMMPFSFNLQYSLLFPWRASYSNYFVFSSLSFSDFMYYTPSDSLSYSPYLVNGQKFSSSGKNRRVWILVFMKMS